MEKNKTGRYLKYAIGEIILVVIGILIALQINNANESRKADNVKHNYYNQIVLDLDKEIENINERVIYLDSSITTWNTYHDYIKTPDLEPSQIFEEVLKVDKAFRYLAFNTNTIQTLESTGEIKLMPNAMRNSLIELKRTQEQLSRVAKGNYEVYLASHEKILQMGFLRLRDQTPTVKKLGIENNLPKIILTFEGGLLLKNYTDKLVKNELEEMLKEINHIKKLIHLDLKS